jgi:hypothetical protein
MQMDKATFDLEAIASRKAYESLKEQIRHKYAGQYVALGTSGILAAAPKFDDVLAAVAALHPAPAYHLIFPANQEPVFEPYCDF